MKSDGEWSDGKAEENYTFDNGMFGPFQKMINTPHEISVKRSNRRKKSKRQKKKRGNSERRKSFDVLNHNEFVKLQVLSTHQQDATLDIDVTKSRWDTPEHTTQQCIDSDTETEGLNQQVDIKSDCKVVSGMVDVEKLLQLRKTKTKSRHKHRKKKCEDATNKRTRKKHEKEEETNSIVIKQVGNEHTTHQDVEQTSNDKDTKFSKNKCSSRKRKRRNKTKSSSSTSFHHQSYEKKQKRKSNHSDSSINKSSAYSASDSSSTTTGGVRSNKSRSRISSNDSKNETSKKSGKIAQKKIKRDVRLPWQPPLEYGEEMEEEITMVIKPAKEKSKIVEKKVTSSVGKNTEDKAKFETPVQDEVKDLKIDEDDLDDDLEDIDALLTSAMGTKKQLKSKNVKSKIDIKEKMLRLQQSITKDKQSGISEVNNNESHTNSPCDHEDEQTSDNVGGFGFLHKYEPTKVEEVEVISVEKLQDVGIWSDEENCSMKIKPTTSTAVNKVTSKEATNTKIIAGNKLRNGKAVSQSKENLNVDENDVGELQLHEPLSTSKKTFKFNIKLPKPVEALKSEKKHKKRKKSKKKLKINETAKPKINEGIDKSATTSCNATIASTTVTITCTNNIVTNPTTINYTTNMITQPMIPQYNPYFPMHPHFMGPRGIPPPHMYPHLHQFPPQFMGYHQTVSFPMSMRFNPPLPSSVKPPLPVESEPGRPPEPTYDSKRLSIIKVAEMFASQEITKKNLEKFFDENIIDVNLPSPASSHSSGRYHKKLRRKHCSRSRHRHRSSSSSRDSSLSSRRSYSSDRSSYSHRGRRTSSTDSRRSSCSSDDSYHRRSHRGRSRTSSYFSSYSDRSSSYTSSSGSDVDRPCRHYRSRKGRRSFSPSSSSDATNDSRKRPLRRSRDWSRSSYSSRSSDLSD